MFPSSFSIAALIGAAAIREQVVTKLRWNAANNEEKNDAGEEEDAALGDHENIDMKRRFDTNNINEDESLAETKRCKTEKEDQLVNEPKVDFNHLKESPFLEQLKFAKCFLKENQSFFHTEARSSVQRSEDVSSQETDLKADSPHSHSPAAALVPRMGLPPRQSPLPSEYKQQASPGSSIHSKQSIVNSNTKQLEKVSECHCIAIGYQVKTVL